MFKQICIVINTNEIDVFEQLEWSKIEVLSILNHSEDISCILGDVLFFWSTDEFLENHFS